MRIINLIVVHCSATRGGLYALSGRFGPVAPAPRIQRNRLSLLHPQGWNGAPHRPIERIGAHAKGFNAHSIGICYEGGLDCRGRPADTRTPAQRATLRQLVGQLQEKFSGCRVCGHRDLSPDLNGNGEIEPEEWIKQCP